MQRGRCLSLLDVSKPVAPRKHLPTRSHQQGASAFCQVPVLGGQGTGGHCAPGLFLPLGVVNSNNFHVCKSVSVSFSVNGFPLLSFNFGWAALLCTRRGQPVGPSVAPLPTSVTSGCFLCRDASPILNI